MASCGTAGQRIVSFLWGTSQKCLFLFCRCTELFLQYNHCHAGYHVSRVDHIAFPFDACCVMSISHTNGACSLPHQDGDDGFFAASSPLGGGNALFAAAVVPRREGDFCSFCPFPEFSSLAARSYSTFLHCMLLCFADIRVLLPP